MARGPQSKEKKIGKEGSISRRSRRQREKATAAAMCRRPRFLSGLLLLLARFDSPPMSPGGTGRSSVWLSFHVKSGNERSTPRRALVGQPPSSGSAARLLFLEARGRPCACAQATALERRRGCFVPDSAAVDFAGLVSADGQRFGDPCGALRA